MEELISQLQSQVTAVRGEKCASVHASKWLISILRMRKAHVELVYQAEGEKEETARVRATLEKADSELQNLLYERRYYESEIKLCRGFNSKYSDASVNLQDEARFWEEADEDLKEVARAASPNAQPQDGMEIEEEGSLKLTLREKERAYMHVLMLQRLEHEMRQRRQMALDLDALKRQKAALLQSVSTREKNLKVILSSIQELSESAQSLASTVGSNSPLLHRPQLERAAADLLPPPLYILYSQLLSTIHIHNLPFTCIISGPIEDVLEPCCALPAAAAPLSTFFPLSVDLSLLNPVGNKALTVQFKYHVGAALVTASCPDAPKDDKILAMLYAGDDGLVIPHEPAASTGFKSESFLPALPYKWCQHLAGIDLIPPPFSSPTHSTSLMASYRQEQRAITFLQKLMESVKDRIKG